MTRIYEVVRLTKQGLSISEIAEAMEIHRVTVTRDKKRARDVGLLPPMEPRPPKTEKAKKSLPRMDLAKSWLTATDALFKKARSLADMRADDRYRRRLPDLMRTRSELIAAQQVISEILADMEAVRMADEAGRTNEKRTTK
jgi:transposase